MLWTCDKIHFLQIKIKANIKKIKTEKKLDEKKKMGRIIATFPFTQDFPFYIWN
jgi:hypothetical protein